MCCLLCDLDAQATVEELKRSLAEKEQRIEQLVGEVNRCDERSEVMSTSTVSRAEEMHRLKDVEDSLEDRYNKLKSLAVRMKKKMAEQTLELSEKSTKLAAALAREKAGGVHISSQVLIHYLQIFTTLTSKNIPKKIAGSVQLQWDTFKYDFIIF